MAAGSWHPFPMYQSTLHDFLLQIKANPKIFTLDAHVDIVLTSGLNRIISDYAIIYTKIYFLF